MSTRPVDISELPPCPSEALHNALKSGVLCEGRCQWISHSSLPAQATVMAKQAYGHRHRELDAMVNSATQTLSRYIYSDLMMNALDRELNGVT